MKIGLGTFLVTALAGFAQSTMYYLNAEEIPALLAGIFGLLSFQIVVSLYKLTKDK